MFITASQLPFPPPSFAMWGLACGSPWLQTLNCNSLLIPNKPIFAREITGSLFVLGQHFGDLYRDPEKTPDGLVSKQVQFPHEPIAALIFSLTLEFEGTSPGSEPLPSLKLSRLYLGSILRSCPFWIRHVLYSSTHLILKSDCSNWNWLGFSPFLWELRLFHQNCASSAFGPFL